MLSSTLKHIGRVAGLAGLLGAAAAAQTPPFSLEVVAINSFPLKEPVTHVAALPGDVMTVEVLLRDWSPNGEVLRAYQATIDPDGYTSGDAGKIEPVDFDTTSLLGEENASNCFVDTTNPRFVHAGLKTIPLADSISLAYRWLSVLLAQDESPYCAQDGEKFYVGTLRVRVSDDARGLFTLGLAEDSGSCGLRDPDNKPIIPLDLEPLTIEVVEGAGVLRIRSSSPPRDAIDARQPPQQTDNAAGALSTIELTFMGHTEELTTSDFLIEDGTTNPPRVASMSVDGTTVTLTLDHRFTPGAWTTITHNTSQKGTRIGCLPGDANNDGVANADDVLALIAGQGDGETLPLYRSDINRDGVFSLADALRILDLLTEPDVFRKTLRE